MPPTTIPLEQLIREATIQDQPQALRDEPEIFPSDHSPMLHSNKMNRILIYHGSFNPPHRGHLACISHAFYRAPAHLNIIAAIVQVTTDDYLLNTKFKDSDESIQLSHADRRKLWNTESTRPEWLWCYPNGESPDLGAFIDDVGEKALAKGFSTQWIPVCGPDIVQSGCEGTSVVCGSVEDLPLEGITTRAKNWQLEDTAEAYQEQCRALAGGDPGVVLRRLYPELEAEGEDPRALLLDKLENTGRPRTAQCQSHKPPCSKYFIPTETIEATNGTPVAACRVSSTAIRKSVREAKDSGDLNKMMRDDVLDHEAFIQMLKDGGHLY